MAHIGRNRLSRSRLYVTTTKLFSVENPKRQVRREAGAEGLQSLSVESCGSATAFLSAQLRSRTNSQRLHPSARPPRGAQSQYRCVREFSLCLLHRASSFWPHLGACSIGVLRLRGCFALRSNHFAQDDRVFHRPLIDSPANAICAPHVSAKSVQHGFFDSIRTIFFDLLQPFSCFSRPMAL